MRLRIYLSLKTRLHKYTPQVRGMVLFVAAAAQMQTVGLTVCSLHMKEISQHQSLRCGRCPLGPVSVGVLQSAYSPNAASR